MLGQRLRSLRHERGLSLKQLSEQAGISIALLSQVERDQLDPSLDTLRKLAKALNVPLFTLFHEPTDNGIAVVRRSRRASLIAGPGAVAYSRISPGFGRLEMLEGVLEPGAMSSPELWEHNSEECAVVLEGTLTVEFSDEVHVLSAGDSIYFDSKRAHRYINRGNERCIYIVAVTPPSF
ncbi:MAG: cupin domain-containing protein [Firmicutes bacterium]|nr:cupin domain-containing protein [Bacillota bacterium]